MDDTSNRVAVTGIEGEMAEHTKDGKVGSSQEGKEFSSKRRRPSIDTTEVSARSPRLAAAVTTATLQPAPHIQTSATSTFRPPTTAISSLIHPSASTDHPFRRRPLDTSAPETFARPWSPARSHASTSSIQRSRQTTMVQSSDSDPLTRRPPRIPSPEHDIIPQPHPSSIAHFPPYAHPTRHSVSPVSELNRGRQDVSRPYTASEPYIRSPRFTDLPSSSRPIGAIGLSHLNERPLYFSAQEVTSSRDLSFDPRRAMSSASGPSRHGGRGSPSRESSEAWFSLGPMEPVDMRQWDERDRDTYQRGYTDALKAVQRGVIGINGQQYPRPQLLKRDSVIPGDDEYLGRRPSLTDATRSFFPEGSAREPLSPHTRSADRALPPHHYPLHPPYDRIPHHQSTSAWADDRRADYAQYQYSVPPPTHHPRPGLGPGQHTHPGGRGPYWPANDPNTYSSSEQSSYAANLVNYPSQSSTSPGGITRTGARQLISCYPCRTRKMKCDGAKPCTQCVRRGGEADCTFANAVRRRGKGKKAPGGSQAGQSGSEAEEGDNDSGQESVDERWRRDGMDRSNDGGSGRGRGDIVH